MIDVRPQVLLEGLVLLFRLAVGLRVVRGAEPPLNAQVVAECCPKFRRKLRPAIGHYA